MFASIGQIQMGNDPGGNGGVGPFTSAKQQRFYIGAGLLVVRDGIGVIARLKGLVSLRNQTTPRGELVALGKSVLGLLGNGLHALLLIKGSASIMKLMIMICIYIIKEIQKANRKQIKRQLERSGAGALKPVVLRLFGLG
ncbi:hypothetical protein [Alcaligenes aquatilis]|uniref:hypothetical protein n=1 Tax=Alcaligenes aquatilis TaxID=323284 RepID=UPI003D2304F9